MGKLRVALIGAGDISQYHLRGWAKRNDVAIVAVCDTDLQRAEGRASDYAISSIYSDAEKMFLSEEIDAVDIATWRHSHIPLCRLALKHGVHVLCQKPLTEHYSDAVAFGLELEGAARVMVHENRRFASHFRQAHAWIEEGHLGQIRQCIMTSWRSSLIKRQDGSRPAVERASYFAKETRLAIGETLIHQLDVLRFLLGEMNVLAATTARTEPDLPGDTLATIMLATRSNAPVVVAGNLVAPGFDSQKGDAPLGARAADRLEIIGEFSSICMEGDWLRMKGAVEREFKIDSGANYQTSFDAATAHFVDCIRTGQPFETSVQDNLQTLKLVDDAYQSADLH